MILLRRLNMKLKDIFEDAEGGVTSVGTGAIAPVQKKAFPQLMKRDYVALFLKKRKLNRDKFTTL